MSSEVRRASQTHQAPVSLPQRRRRSTGDGRHQGPGGCQRLRHHPETGVQRQAGAAKNAITDR